MPIFTIEHRQGKARTGLLKTKTCTIRTPFFMPVSTKAAAKHLSAEDLVSIGAQATICNSYILSLRPGVPVIKKLGGIGKFMRFPKAIFTDSGGFQMYSKTFWVKTTHKGVIFKNPFSGERLLVTPEDSMKIQYELGSDVAMCLDHMPLIENSKEEIEQAVQTTSEWAGRGKISHDKLRKKQKNLQLLFGITQGGIHDDLRRQSAKELKELDFDGYALGGLALGEDKQDEFRMIELQKRIMPEEKICYLMGVGDPLELLEAVSRGVDCFDSRFPTQNARRGTIFTSEGKLRLLSRPYEKDGKPLDTKCNCFVCRNYSRAYIRYQLLQQEGVGFRLASYHNLYYLQMLMEKAQEMIKRGKLHLMKKHLAGLYE